VDYPNKFASCFTERFFHHRSPCFFGSNFKYDFVQAISEFRQFRANAKRTVEEKEYLEEGAQQEDL